MATQPYVGSELSKVARGDDSTCGKLFPLCEIVKMTGRKTPKTQNGTAVFDTRMFQRDTWITKIETLCTNYVTTVGP